MLSGSKTNAVIKHLDLDLAVATVYRGLFTAIEAIRFDFLKNRANGHRVPTVAKLDNTCQQVIKKILLNR